jgi:hypothetical protein
VASSPEVIGGDESLELAVALDDADPGPDPDDPDALVPGGGGPSSLVTADACDSVPPSVPEPGADGSIPA